jgi:Domain of unknown function (DUF1902)
MAKVFKVKAVWDHDAGVFYSQSDIPGLVVEADTFEAFVCLVELLAPEMLEANAPEITRPYRFEIESHRVLEVA